MVSYLRSSFKKSLRSKTSKSFKNDSSDVLVYLVYLHYINSLTSQMEQLRSSNGNSEVTAEQVRRIHKQLLREYRG
ncbi:uncharacterized protein PRCAT00000859001 [Priceomyces carsonii]|uniref:uncharacterized protein n=1 Tax=Priceomyces carsonii TaxID=28549 RepID=UPI002ED8353A|nr:unnamed protein product [Priceomyces carsonii]